VGDIFSDEVNKERKKPFDIRTVMRAVVDQDFSVLERWAGMADADTTVVMDAHLGGYPIAMLGIESRPIPRRGWFPADGPDQWTAERCSQIIEEDRPGHQHSQRQPPPGGAGESVGL